jgi:long-chain acyl-CoA synthetase
MPWLNLYGSKPHTFLPLFNNCLAMFHDAVRKNPTATALRYFDGHISYEEEDSLSQDLAVVLREYGVVNGDRIAIILQNIPQFPIATIACWKIGAIPVPCNPMYSERELAQLFNDAQPQLVICQSDRVDVTKAAMRSAGLADQHVIGTSPMLYQTRNDRRVLDAFLEDVAEPGWGAVKTGQSEVPEVAIATDEAGLLLYTSGTTGRPKGAVLSHGALAFNAETSTLWFDLGVEPSILALAPLFHVTGFVCHFCAALRARGYIVLTYRFHPAVTLDAIREYRPRFAMGAITAYNALMNAPGADAETFACFHRLYSGGAPISPAIAAKFLERTGQRILPAYGMTETTAPTHVVPAALDTPIDTNSGAYSIGIPTSSVDAKVVDDVGAELPPGVPGELLLVGPQLMSGYWRRDAETAEAMMGGWFHTGDVAIMDEQGWFYIVDRKKDVIIASGFKVWPREVEDVLYLFPGIREAVVVGIADDYRGQTVKAYVSLACEAQIKLAELEAFCRDRLAAYKVPRVIEVLDDLPRTATGKLMRAALRERTPGGAI